MDRGHAELLRIGLIADTHGLLRPEVRAFLAGSDHVVLHVLHDLADLAIDPAAAGVQVVVSGHSHQPRVSRRDGVLYVNPGSAGPRRFRLPIAAAELQVQGREVSARVREFAV